MAESEMGDMFAIDVVDIRGVPTKVFRNAPPSLRAIWDISALYPTNTYLVNGDERVTYADAHHDVRAVVRWMTELVRASPRSSRSAPNYVGR